MGFLISDNAFFDMTQDSEDIEIDLVGHTVKVADREFRVELGAVETELMKAGGIAPAFKKFGKQLFNASCVSQKVTAKKASVLEDIDEPAKPLQW